MDVLLQEYLLEIIYLIASVTFVIGLKMLSGPKTARNGNLIAAFGMGIAMLGTIFLHKDEAGHGIGNLGWIFGGIALGTVIGWVIAKKVKMTAMPQMVSFFNGMGGACAGVISMVEFNKFASHAPAANAANFMNGEVLVMMLGLIIGSVSFSGSMIAYGKLEGKIRDKALPLQQIVNVLFMAGFAALTYYTMTGAGGNFSILYVIFGLALLYGVLFVMPIGGADMPVVISLLNSFTGLAAAFGGFLYDNQAMLTGGILVGSAGTILTILMCQAMNRSLMNVIIGSFGGAAGGAKAVSEYGTVKEISVNDLAILCNYAQRVAIVPGYGLAVAQAQHVCHELESMLEKRGVDVKYAIHPVAGRMPGHMNVLLAEADVAYDKLLEMEDANPLFKTTDVVIVIGANDVVNPAAEDEPASPIYGMPILKVTDAQTVVIMKRSMSVGYAGIQNRLFFMDNARMLFGDGKDSMQKLVAELKNV